MVMPPESAGLRGIWYHGVAGAGKSRRAMDECPKAYRNASMDLVLGGGKTVIMGDSKTMFKTPAQRDKFFQALGRFVESLNGRYVTAEDVNVGCDDCVSMAKQTNHVVGPPGKSGNPSPVTA